MFANRDPWNRKPWPTAHWTRRSHPHSTTTLHSRESCEDTAEAEFLLLAITIIPPLINLLAIAIIVPAIYALIQLRRDYSAGTMAAAYVALVFFVLNFKNLLINSLQFFFLGKQAMFF